MPRKMETMPNIQDIRSHFDYCHETGVITWKASNHIKNTRRVGTEAGHSSGPGGYRKITFRGRGIYSHLIAWGLYYGGWPASELDHVNRQRSDNRISNLREVDVAENAANKPRRNNKTGFSGVVLYRSGRYMAGGRIRGKYFFAGYHDTPEEAHAAYVRKHQEAFGEFSIYRETIDSARSAVSPEVTK